MMIPLGQCDESVIRGLMALHKRHLAESIFARLGDGFLRLTYERFFCAEGAYGWAYVHDGKVAGLITCVTDFQTWVGRTIRRHGLRIAWSVATGCLTNGRVLRECLGAVRFLRTSGGRGDRQPAAEIVSFVVDPECRKHAANSTKADPALTPFYRQTGVSVAETLFREAVRALANAGAGRLRIMTLANNPASNGFYVKCGCRPAGPSQQYLGVPVQLYEAPMSAILERLRLVEVS